MSDVTGVIFDCDGTLLDSMGVWRALEAELACSTGVALTPEDVEALNPLTIPEVGDFFHTKFGLANSGAEVVTIIDEFMLKKYGAMADARPGVLSFIKLLAKRNVKMSVASSTPPHLLEIALESVGLTPYLCAIVSVDDVGHSKREPHVFNHARTLMETPIESTWVFEDSAFAIQTARKAGYDTVGIYDRDDAGTWKDLQDNATVAFKSFEEIDFEKFMTGAYR